MISCGIVVPASGISTRRRRAASTALRTASLTSFALPVAIPTRPCPSPTATSALNPKRRPPFTTFATRLMEMTFSTSPSPSRWRSLESRRSPPRPPPPAPPARPPPPPPPPAQRDAPGVVHHLGVDVLRGAEHDEARPLRTTRHLAAYPQVPPVAAALPRPHFMNRSHGLFRRLGGLAGLAPDLLARVSDPLAFVGLGRPDRADLRRYLAHELLVHALDLHDDVVVHRDLDPLRRVIRHRMGEADDELHAERLWLRLVAHPLDLERLRKPLGDAVHHVGDERAGEPVERLVPGLVGGPPHDDRLALHRHGQLGVDQPADLALRALHGNPRPVELGRDALGNGDRLPADARHGPASYQTSASSSPPTRAVRASRSVMSPCGVDRIAIPRPFLTRGISRALT